MTRTFDITVMTVDNGFQIKTRPDDRKGQILVATTKGDVNTILADVITHIFDPLPEKAKPKAPAA